MQKQDKSIMPYLVKDIAKLTKYNSNPMIEGGKYG